MENGFALRSLNCSRPNMVLVHDGNTERLNADMYI